MRGPLPVVTGCYIFGVLVAACISLPVSWLFVIACVVAIVALLSDSRRSVLLWPLISLVGSVNLTVRTAVISPADLRLLLEDRSEITAIQGAIASPPTYRVYEKNSKPAQKSMARVRVEAIRQGSEWRSAYGSVAVSTPGTLAPCFFAGQAVEISGVLAPPRGPTAEGLFDYRRYLSNHGIYYQLIVDSTNDWTLRTTPGAARSPPLSDRFSRWARIVLARGLPDGDPSVDLLRAMALGWKTGLTGEVSEPFMRSGTLHIFAISGLHVAMIAGILVSLARLVRVPRAACGLVVIPMLWFYTAATGWQPSAIRSTIMMSVIIAGWTLRRPPDLLNSLAAASLIILVWEPRQLFQASFQLSFFVVLSIALFLPPIERWRQRLLQTDPFLPPELRPRWQRQLDGPLRYVTTSAATSLAAWLGSLPIVAYYFHLVTPVSLLANVMVVPLSGFALMSCLGSLACGEWLATVGEVFNHSGWFWMRCMVGISEWAATLPGAFFYVHPPGFSHFCAYYLLLVGLASGWMLASVSRRWISAGGLVCLAGWAGWSWQLDQQSVRITVLPMGGAGLFVDAAGRNRDLLIDCGPASAGDFIVKPFLRSRGANRIPSLLLTHGDLQHVGGFDQLKAQFPIGEIATSAIRFRSSAYRQISLELAKEPARWRQVHRGDAICGWRVLHPERDDRFSQADDSALVLWTEVNGTSVLLLSDLGKLGQRKLLEREPGLRADIIVTGLPSQGEPVEDQLLRRLSPQILIVASAEYPVSARAGRALRKRLDGAGVPVIYTRDAGAATIEIQPGKCTVRTMGGSPVTMPAGRKP